MRRRHLLSIGVIAMAVATMGLVVAQAPEAPKPTAEHAKLGYFVGNWQAEGKVNDSPFFPGGKMTSKDRCEWFAGKFAVVCHSEGTGPLGPMNGIGIMSYSPDTKSYTYYGHDSTGMMIMTTVPHGTVNGKTWTYTDESKMGEQTVKSRYVLNELSPTSYTFKWEMQGPDGAWMTLMEGTTTKKS